MLETHLGRHRAVFQRSMQLLFVVAVILPCSSPLVATVYNRRRQLGFRSETHSNLRDLAPIPRVTGRTLVGAEPLGSSNGIPRTAPENLQTSNFESGASSRLGNNIGGPSQKPEGTMDTAFSATCTVVTLSGLEVRGQGTRSTKKQAKIAAAYEALGFMKAVAAEFMRAVTPEPSAQGGEGGGESSAVVLDSQSPTSEAGRNPVGVLKEMLDAKKVKSIIYEETAATPKVAAAARGVGEKDSAEFSNTSKGMRQRLRRSRRRLEVVNCNNGSGSSNITASDSTTAAIATESSVQRTNCKVCNKEFNSAAVLREHLNGRAHAAAVAKAACAQTSASGGAGTNAQDFASGSQPLLPWKRGAAARRASQEPNAGAARGTNNEEGEAAPQLEGAHEPWSEGKSFEGLLAVLSHPLDAAPIRPAGLKSTSLPKASSSPKARSPKNSSLLSKAASLSSSAPTSAAPPSVVTLPAKRTRSVPSTRSVTSPPSQPSLPLKKKATVANATTSTATKRSAASSSSSPAPAPQAPLAPPPSALRPERARGALNNFFGVAEGRRRRSSSSSGSGSAATGFGRGMLRQPVRSSNDIGCDPPHRCVELFYDPSRPPSELLGTVTSSSPFFGDFNSAEKANRANSDSAKVNQHLYQWAAAAKHWNVLPSAMEPIMASVPNRTSTPTTTAVGAATGAGPGAGAAAGFGASTSRSARSFRNRRSRAGKLLGRVTPPSGASSDDVDAPKLDYDDESDDEQLLLFDPSALESYSSSEGTVKSSKSSKEQDEMSKVLVGTSAELNAATAEWDLQQAQQSKKNVKVQGSEQPSWESMGPLLRDRAIEAAKQRQPRIIAIGDVHGCIDELQLLLKKCDYQPGDALVFLGDLVAKGPDSCAVVQMAYELGAMGVRGNHEFEVIRWHHALSNGMKAPPIGGEHFHIACALSPREMKWIRNCPWYMSAASVAKAATTSSSSSGGGGAPPSSSPPDFSTSSSGGSQAPWNSLWSPKAPSPSSPSSGASGRLGPEDSEPGERESSDLARTLFVHAGFVAGLKMQRQNPRLMMNMRSILPDGSATAKHFSNWPWARLWDGPESVVFGHDADRGLQLYDRATGIDTGCVYGGRLTAYLLPEQKLVSVSAKRQYLAFKPKRT